MADGHWIITVNIKLLVSKKKNKDKNKNKNKIKLFSWEGDIPNVNKKFDNNSDSGIDTVLVFR